MANKRKILWISDFFETGYGSATNELIKSIIGFDCFEIDIFIINRHDNYEKLKEDAFAKLDSLKEENIYAIKYRKELENIYTAGNQKDLIKTYMIDLLSGALDLDQVIMQSKPDIIWAINDNAVIAKYCKVINRIRENTNMEFKFVGYMPADCRNFRPDFFKNVEDCDEIITFYKDAATEISKSFIKNKEHRHQEVQVLHHIINTENFYKLPDEKVYEIKKRLLGPGAIKSFVINNLNVNQYRKRIDLTLRAFWEFCYKYPTKGAQSVLILKGGNKHLGDGIYCLEDIIKKLTEEYKINHSNRIVILQKRLSIDELRELHSIANIHVSTTSGEGWGLVPCESALCGVRQIVPDNTSHREIFGDTVDYIETYPEPHLVGHGMSKQIKSLAIPYIISTSHYHKLYNLVDESIEFLPNVTTYLLSSKGLDSLDQKSGLNIQGTQINFHFKTFEYLFDYLGTLDDNNELPELFQVILETGENLEYVIKNYQILKKHDKLLENVFKKSIRKTVQKNNKLLLQQSDGYSVTVDIPKVESLVDLINKAYDCRNDDKYSIKNNECMKRVYNNFNREVIGKQLKDLLLKIKDSS